MFSGGDSSGDGFNNRQQLTNYFTAPTGNIDWASLAQQWIQMQSTGNNQFMDFIPETEPMSINVRIDNAQKKHVIRQIEEKGEADMDMEDESEVERKNDLESPPPPPPDISSLWYLQQSSNQMSIDEGMANQHSSNQWNIWPPRVTMPPPPVVNVPMINPTAHIPPLMKINVPNPNTVDPTIDNVDDGTGGNSGGNINAAKRKKLPAWIREGLEKMEREKQKQMDKEDQTKETLNDVKSTNVTTIDNKDSLKEVTVNDTQINEKNLESESSGNEEEGNNDRKTVTAATKAKGIPKPFLKNEDKYAENVEGIRSGKSFEERMADLMINVRRTLTELLLEVTNEEISKISHEAIKSHKMKASSAQVIHKSALSSLTGKLGLAAYVDSSTESSDSENENSDNQYQGDSEEELKALIRSKHRSFSKISNEIEEQLAISAAREEQKIKYYSSLEEQEKIAKTENVKTSECDELDIATGSSAKSLTSLFVGKGYSKDFGETTETKLHLLNGKWQKDRSSLKERTTRFSDNKDSKSKSIAATASYMCQIQNSVNIIKPVLPTTALVSTGVQDPNGLYTAAASSTELDSNSNSNKKNISEKLQCEKNAKSNKTKNRKPRSSSSSSTSTSSSSSPKRRRSREKSRSRHKSYKRSERGRNDHRQRSKRSNHSSDSEDDHYFRRSRRYSDSRSRSKSRSSYSSSSKRHRY